MGCFASGRRRDEISRHPAILGSLPRASRFRSGTGRQELPTMAEEPSPRVSPFPPFAGRPRALLRGHWGSLQGAWTNGLNVSRRALANPEVQNFRDLFGGEIRTVRNLKE